MRKSVNIIFILIYTGKPQFSFTSHKTFLKKLFNAETINFFVILIIPECFIEHFNIYEQISLKHLCTYIKQYISLTVY